MLLDSEMHFMTFNLKTVSVTRHPVPKSIISHSFSGIDMNLVFVEQRVNL